jgi:hypothetical protein
VSQYPCVGIGAPLVSGLLSTASVTRGPPRPLAAFSYFSAFCLSSAGYYFHGRVLVVLAQASFECTNPRYRWSLFYPLPSTPGWTSRSRL